MQAGKAKSIQKNGEETPYWDKYINTYYPYQ